MRPKLKKSAWAGVKKGWYSFIWVCGIIVPVSFVMMMLQWIGWFNRVDFIFIPLMDFLNLPPEAAVPILLGMLVNLYACIGVLNVIHFSPEQMVLIAIFNLIAHSLIVEGMVQSHSGINFVKATLIRISVAIVTVFIVSRIIGNTDQAISLAAVPLTGSPFLTTLMEWAISTIILLLEILGIVMFIMIILEISRDMGWVNNVLGFFSPIMRLMGLSRETTTMFIAGNVFGLLYGSAVIVEESKKGHLTRDKVERLHISLGINHSIIEDPALFAVLGVNLLWSWLPRLFMAILVVHSYGLVKKFRRTGFAKPFSH